MKSFYHRLAGLVAATSLAFNPASAGAKEVKKQTAPAKTRETAYIVDAGLSGKIKDSRYQFYADFSQTTNEYDVKFSIDSAFDRISVEKGVRVLASLHPVKSPTLYIAVLHKTNDPDTYGFAAEQVAGTLVPKAVLYKTPAVQDEEGNDHFCLANGRGGVYVYNPTQELSTLDINTVENMLSSKLADKCRDYAGLSLNPLSAPQEETGPLALSSSDDRRSFSIPPRGRVPAPSASPAAPDAPALDLPLETVLRPFEFPRDLCVALSGGSKKDLSDAVKKVLDSKETSDRMQATIDQCGEKVHSGVIGVGYARDTKGKLNIGITENTTGCSELGRTLLEIYQSLDPALLQKTGCWNHKHKINF